jgi:hypothetical protein
MAYELTGKIKIINETQTYGSGFEKREAVIVDDSNPKYPQEINFEFVQDKVNLLDSVEVGQEVTVTFDIRGREYNGKYFNNLQAWKLVAATPPQDEEVPADFEEYEDSVPL